MAATPSSGEQQATLEALERQVAQLGSGISNRSADSGLPLHGFADVGLSRSGEKNAVRGKGSKGFNVGSLDLYLTPQFGDRVRSLVELVFEVDKDGGVATDLERGQMGYAFSDAATAWADRNQTRLGMFGAYAVYASDRWEFLGEYYGFRNRDLSSGTGAHSSWAAYLQAGYNIGKMTPYARLEKTSLDQTDNYFAVQESGRSYSRAALGLRYDLDPKAAIKFESCLSGWLPSAISR